MSAGPACTYAQWVSSAIALARRSPDGTTSFFESSVPEPRELLEQVVGAATRPHFSRYYSSAFNAGNPFVIEMLAEEYGVAPEQVLCTSGATSALGLLYRALARPGDHALVESPGFDVFRILAEDLGIAVEAFPRTGADFQLDVAAVVDRIRPDTRLIILSNLHNPSGMPLDYDRLRTLAAIADERGVPVVVDEVYGGYARASVRPVAAAALSPNIVSVSSLTKIFGLSTLRCGWIVGSPGLMARLRSVAARVEFSISNLAHAVAAHVISNPAPFRQYVADMLGEARPILEACFSNLSAEGLIEGTLPDDGCICFPRLSGIDDTEGFADWLLRRSGVIVAPGEYFGAPGHVRIGFGHRAAVMAPALAAFADGLRTYRALRGPGAAAGEAVAGQGSA